MYISSLELHGTARWTRWYRLWSQQDPDRTPQGATYSRRHSKQTSTSDIQIHRALHKIHQRILQYTDTIMHEISIWEKQSLIDAYRSYLHSSYRPSPYRHHIHPNLLPSIRSATDALSIIPPETYHNQRRGIFSVTLLKHYGETYNRWNREPTRTANAIKMGSSKFSHVRVVITATRRLNVGVA